MLSFVLDSSTLPSIGQMHRGVTSAHTYTSIHTLLCSCLEVDHIHSMASQLRLSSAFLLLLLLLLFLLSLLLLLLLLCCCFLFSPHHSKKTRYLDMCTMTVTTTTTSSIKRRREKNNKMALFVACTDTRQNRSISLPPFFVSHCSTFVRLSNTPCYHTHSTAFTAKSCAVIISPFKNLG